MAGYILILGIILVLTPVVIAIMDGVGDEVDVITWLVKKPLEFIGQVQGMIIGGICLIFSAACMAYLK